MSAADEFNAKWPVGTTVRYFRGYRNEEGSVSRTRTPAWELPSGATLVSVDGYPGGIALSHVDVVVGEEPESAANGPSETRPERLDRAATELRNWPGASFDHWTLSLIADVLDEVAHGKHARPLPITRAADRLARSLLGEPEVDR